MNCVRDARCRLLRSPHLRSREQARDSAGYGIVRARMDCGERTRAIERALRTFSVAADVPVGRAVLWSSVRRAVSQRVCSKRMSARKYPSSCLGQWVGSRRSFELRVPVQGQAKSCPAWPEPQSCPTPSRRAEPHVPVRNFAATRTASPCAVHPRPTLRSIRSTWFVCAGVSTHAAGAALIGSRHPPAAATDTVCAPLCARRAVALACTSLQFRAAKRGL
jgi:hypothetical protein